MAKLFDTSEEFIELIDNKYSETGLDTMGINLKVISTTKAKDVLKVKKTSAETSFLTKERGDSIVIILYEEAFDRLPKNVQELLVEMTLSNVSYNTEKDRLNIENNPYIQLFNMRKKYGDTFMDSVELSYLTIQQIEEEEKARKEEEKLNKKNKNN